MPELPEWVSERQGALESILQALLTAPAHPLGSFLNPDDVPTDPGLYAISFKTAGPGEYVHAGLAKVGGLKRRIWDDHCRFGNTSCDLVWVVMEERRIDRPTAKKWIGENCQVQWTTDVDPLLLRWAEDFALSLLRPKWELIQS